MTKAVAKRDANKKRATRDEAWELEGLNEKEVAEAEAIKAAVYARPNRPVMVAKRGEGGKLIVSAGKSEVKGNGVLNSIRCFGAFGSGSNGFTGDMLNRLIKCVNTTGNDELDSERITGAVALVASIDPQNELEA